MFEGWFVGFRPISESSLQEKYEKSCEWQRHLADLSSEASRISTQMLVEHSSGGSTPCQQSSRAVVHNVYGISAFDYLVHLDTENLENVYAWRLDQEEKTDRLWNER